MQSFSETPRILVSVECDLKSKNKTISKAPWLAEVDGVEQKTFTVSDAVVSAFKCQ